MNSFSCNPVRSSRQPSPAAIGLTWFTKPVTHHTDDGVNVFNVIEGDELIVESPTNAFEPFVVHYAETFIVPASVGEYTIRPYGTSEGKECGTIKAYVRFRQ